jgi:hypothetical protein
MVFAPYLIEYRFGWQATGSVAPTALLIEQDEQD